MPNAARRRRQKGIRDEETLIITVDVDVDIGSNCQLALVYWCRSDQDTLNNNNNNTKR